MAWMRVTDREKAYEEWVLDTPFEDQKPAMIDRNVITFVGEDGKQEFLAAVPDEASYDRSCGVDSGRNAGPQDQWSVPIIILFGRGKWWA